VIGDASDTRGSACSALGSPRRVVHHAGSPEFVLAVDLQTLPAQARRCKGVVEFVPQVGDFVAYDEPLFALYGGADAIDDRALRTTVAFGRERTLEQDPTRCSLFAFSSTSL
jgi:uncharacterized membrane protein